MKRPLEEEEAGKDGSREPRRSGQGVTVRVLPPPTGRVFAYDEDGKQTFCAPTAPMDVQNAVNKRVFREKEWGKNVLREERQAESGLDHLDPEDQQVERLLGYAEAELRQLAYFADVLAAGERLQVDHVPETLPPVEEERLMRASRLLLRRAALSKAGAKLRDAANRAKQGALDDSRYYSDLLMLRRRWKLHILGGAKFAAQLLVTHCSTFGILKPQQVTVELLRSVSDGSVELRVGQTLRPRLLVNRNSAWPPFAQDSGVVHGAEQVHLMLMDLQRSARSSLLYSFLSSSVPEGEKLSFASARDQGSSIVLDLLTKAFSTQSTVYSLAQPPAIASSSIDEVLLAYFLSVFTSENHRNDVLQVFGRPTVFLSNVSGKILPWMALIKAHMQKHADVTAALMDLCRSHSGFSFHWGGSDFRIDDDGSASMLSNAYLSYRPLNGLRLKRHVLSIIGSGKLQLNGVSRQWGLHECLATLLSQLGQ